MGHSVRLNLNLMLGEETRARAEDCLLAVVAALHHDCVGEALNDGALRLAEALLLPSAGGVGEERHGLVGVRRMFVMDENKALLR